MGKVATTRITKSGGSMLLRIPKAIQGIYDLKETEIRVDWYIGFDKEIEKISGDEGVVIRFRPKED